MASKLEKNTVLVVFICVLFQIHYRYHIPKLGTDNLLQIAESYSIAKGGGINYPIAKPEDLSKHTLRYFDAPPGYPLILVPFLSVIKDFVLAEFLLGAIAIVLLFYAWLSILNLFKHYFNDGFIASLFIFWTFAYSPFRYLTTVDIIALTFFSWSIYCLLKILQNGPQKKQLTLLVLLSIVAYLGSFFRFAYYPLSFIPSIVFLIYTIFKGKKYLIYFFISAILVGGGLYVQSSWINETMGAHNYLEDEYMDDFTIHWNHLLYHDAIFVNSFFSDYILMKALGLSGYGYDVTKEVFLGIFCISLSIFLLMIKGLVGVIKNIGWLNFQNHLLNFIVVLIVSVGVNTLFLNGLSLRYDNLSEDYTWTWIMLPRYFASTLLILQVIGFVLLFYNKKGVGRFVKKAIALMILVGLAFNFSHWIYIKTKFSLFSYEENLNNLYEPRGAIEEYVKFKDRLCKTKGNKVLVYGNEDKNLRLIALQSGVSVIDYRELKILTSTRPVDVFFPLSKESKATGMDKFIREYNPESFFIMKNAGVNMQKVKIGY